MTDRPQEPFVATEPMLPDAALPWARAAGPATAADAVRDNGFPLPAGLGSATAGQPAPGAARAGSGNSGDRRPGDGYPGGGYPDQAYGPQAGAPEDLGAVDPEDLDLLDTVWAPPRRISRLTVLLAGGLVAAIGFGGGVLVQKNHDAGISTSSAAGAGAAARAFARANGFGGATGGGFGAGTGASAGTGGAGSGTGSGAAGSGSTGSGSAVSGPPVVVGTVVSLVPGTLVVQNFAGTKVTVHVPAGTPVTTTSLSGLRAGVSVSVTGTKAADGTVTATSVQSRSNG
jgi:hypothetical protein